MEFKYKLKRQKEVIFDTTSLDLTLIDDLNQTIDDLFAHLVSSKQEHLLEQLCPYFGTIWPSARALAQVALSLIQKHERVLELGCGLAIPSLLLAQKGCNVTATDMHPEVPKFLAANLNHNHLTSEQLKFLELNWQQLDDAAINALKELKPHWIIASDVLYESYHAKTLANALAQIANPATQIILADPARPYLQLFNDEMLRLGFKQKNMQVIREIFVLEFVKAW